MPYSPELEIGNGFNVAEDKTKSSPFIYSEMLMSAPTGIEG
jgi:hypothetical protein